MKEDQKPKTAWDYIRIYFPDIWQYLVIILTIIIAALFIL
jgi:hypothetical protein